MAWSTKKQSRVVLSTTKAEYMQLTPVGRHLLWMKSLLPELRFPTPGLGHIYCDNLQAISITQDVEVLNT